MNNTIKRNSTYILLEWLVDTSHTKKGEKSALKHDLYGWHDITRNLLVCVSHIRNANLCKIIDQW